MTNLHEISGRLRVIIFHLLNCKANSDYCLIRYFIDNSFRTTVHPNKSTWIWGQIVGVKGPRFGYKIIKNILIQLVAKETSFPLKGASWHCTQPCINECLRNFLSSISHDYFLGLWGSFLTYRPRRGLPSRPARDHVVDTKMALKPPKRTRHPKVDISWRILYSLY